MSNQPFEAMSASTVNIAVGAASASVLVENFSGCNQVRVFNNGSATCWIDFGGSAVSTSQTTGMPIGAGQSIIVSVPSAASTVYAAAIAAAATGNVYFTPGIGGA